MLRMKLRLPSGASSVLSLPAAATVYDLDAAIREAANLPDRSQSYSTKIGHPPRELDILALEPDIPLASTGVKLNGEQLIVLAEGGTAPVAPKPIPASQTAPSPISRPSRPPPAAKRPASPSSEPAEVYLPERSGRLVLRVMPDDNSCLFRAVGACVLPDIDTPAPLRLIVAQAIQSDTSGELYSDAFLGKPRDEYCRWIQGDDSWGGAIELAILSSYFDVEICSIDVLTGRVDRFNSNDDAGLPGRKRCFVVYSGIHYDCIAFELDGYSGSGGSDQRVFDPTDDIILSSALELCKILNSRGYYTDTAGFAIKCNTCGGKFKGEKGAVAHMKESGHSDFSEV